MVTKARAAAPEMSIAASRAFFNLQSCSAIRLDRALQRQAACGPESNSETVRCFAAKLPAIVAHGAADDGADRRSQSSAIAIAYLISGDSANGCSSERAKY